MESLALRLDLAPIRNLAVQTASEKNRTRSQCEALISISERGRLSRSSIGQRIGSKQVRRTVPTARLPSQILTAFVQVLTRTSTAWAEAVNYALKSPTFLPQPRDGRVLSGVSFRARMRMFEQELTPVTRVIPDLLGWQNAAEHLALVGSPDGSSQLVEQAMWPIVPSDLL